MTWDMALIIVTSIAAGYALALVADRTYEKIRERLRR